MTLEPTEYYLSALAEDGGVVKGRFYTKNVIKGAEKIGKNGVAVNPVYVPKDYVEILVHGKSAVNRAATKEDAERFPNAWKAYNGEKVERDPNEAIDLQVLASIGMNEALIQELKGKGIDSVQAFAALPAGRMKMLNINAGGWAEKAREYLKTQPERYLEETAVRVHESEDRIQKLEAKVDSLISAMQSYFGTEAQSGEAKSEEDTKPATKKASKGDE